MRMTSPDSAHHEMNTIIHHGLRRDLDRLELVLAGPLPPEQRTAVCEHVGWMLDYLHHHHVAEDDGVWPRTLAKRPDLQPLVDEMEVEHHTLAEASVGLRAAARAYRSDGSDEARQGLLDAVAHMKATTLPHLDHEEQVAMPLVLETLDDDDWAYLEKNHFRAGLSMAQEAQVLMWMMDDLDSRRAAIAKSQVPGPIFWVLSAIYGPRYDRGAAQRWGEYAGSRT
jgi:hemerythrin-like domain-containing protein